MNSDNDSDSNKSIKSLQTFSAMRDDEVDTIQYRLEFIRSLLDGNKLKPIINFEATDTENYTNSRGETNISTVLDKKLIDFYKVINKTGGKLKYIKSGTTGHAFKGMIKMPDKTTFEYAVKVVAYHKRKIYGSVNNINRPENAELMMIRLLSYFVIKKQTPHIVLPVGTFNTSIKPFLTLIEEKLINKKSSKYAEFIEKYKKDEYYDEVSILISEWANRGDLLDFFRNYYKLFKLIYWKAFFFQLLSVLAIIQSKYPSFRHNDLKANNVLVQKIGNNIKSSLYRIENCEYVVPNIGYQIKLWDFDFACIPGVVDNIKTNTEYMKSINVTPEKNQYYDVHYFFNTLIKKGFLPQIMTEKVVPDEVKEFINRIVPSKYRKGKYVHKRGRILVNDEYLTPDIILKTDPFFESFRKKNKSSSYSMPVSSTSLNSNSKLNSFNSSFKTNDKKPVNNKSNVVSQPKEVVNLNKPDNTSNNNTKEIANKDLDRSNNTKEMVNKNLDKLNVNKAKEIIGTNLNQIDNNKLVINTKNTTGNKLNNIGSQDRQTTKRLDQQESKKIIRSPPKTRPNKVNTSNKQNNQEDKQTNINIQKLDLSDTDNNKINTVEEILKINQHPDIKQPQPVQLINIDDILLNIDNDNN